jgi:hypothetical protein
VEYACWEMADSDTLHDSSAWMFGTAHRSRLLDVVKQWWHKTWHQSERA